MKYKIYILVVLCRMKSISQLPDTCLLSLSNLLDECEELIFYICQIFYLIAVRLNGKLINFSPGDSHCQSAFRLKYNGISIPE